MRIAFARSWPVAVQCAVALIGLAAFASRPPASGRILLVPLSADEGAAARLALEHRASLVGRGPLAGSVVARSGSPDLRAAAEAAGLLVLAAPRSGCGDGTTA